MKRSKPPEPKRLRGRPKTVIEPLDCEPIALSDLEDFVKKLLDAPMPDKQHRENRDPTKMEIEQKFKLKRRR